MNNVSLVTRLIKALDGAIVAHNEGRFFDISIEDSLEQDVAGDDSDYAKQFHIAIEFLSGWDDSAGHDWFHYPGFVANDWPRLAEVIRSDIEARRPISDPKVLDAFGPKPPGPGFLSRLWNSFGL